MKRMLISLLSVVLTAAMFSGMSESTLAAGNVPVAENLELKTYRDASVGGQLKAVDPDEDVLSFEISTKPVKGELEVQEDGSFVYTPHEGKKGRDYFGYKAIDSEGNTSQEATVIIKIEKPKKNVFYSDMDGRADEYAAVELAEKDIFVGEKIGGEYCFNPEKGVSRGEFLAMCMSISDRAILNTVLDTGYADDDSIPGWMKGYVATAAMCGIENGAVSSEGRVFNSTELIEQSEAAEILNKTLNITPVSYVCLDVNLDSETAQACANLSACGILKEGALLRDTLSRAEAAEMLSAALEILENR